MIGRLTGEIVGTETDGGIVLDVHGVGYDVTVPLGTVGRAPTDGSGRVTLFVHTHVREDAFSLFGFASDFERATFRALIAISSVGPKTAIGILGALPASELGRAIAHKDVKQLTSIPGVGKKTAERLVLELADKIPKLGLDAGIPTPMARPKTTRGETVVAALTTMGYKPSEAERAVAALGEGAEEKAVAQLIRDALAILAK